MIHDAEHRRPATTLALDVPQQNARVYDECISVSGALMTSVAPERLSVFCGEICIGSTHNFAHAESNWRFRLLARFPQTAVSEGKRCLRFQLNVAGEAEPLELGEVTVNVVRARLSERPYGDVVAPARSEVLHRENIYGFGPPLEEPGAEIARLILEFLPVKSSVLDFGCGAGAYGPPLIGAGHRWLGAELKSTCYGILERRGLPFSRLSGSNVLPFADAEFDATIAIEVLEHVVELDAVIAEIARIIRGRFLVSVPNMEVIPYYAPLGVVPWHLLESTHVNFFTRASLRAALAGHFRQVEVFTYAEPPVKSPDGIALHAHLFAIANK